MKAKWQAMLFLTLTATVLLPTVDASAAGKKIAGITIPEVIRLEGVSSPLALNGAAVRKKFFFNIYVGALYLSSPSRSAIDIIGDPRARSVAMHFLYKEVSGEKLVEGWNEGFAANLTPAELKETAARLEAFNALFRTARKGDVYRLDFLPGKGTVVRFNGETLGSVEGEDFFSALLKVWLGERPADKKLRKAWLGG